MMNDVIDEYCRTRLAYDEAHELSSQADKEHKAARAKLVEAMVVESTTVAPPEHEGLKFNLRDVFSIACNKDNEDLVKDWLHGHYGDIAEFTVEKVDKKTVVERLQNDIEGEKLDQFDVPDFMKLKNGPDVSVLGWAAYSRDRRA